MLTYKLNDFDFHTNHHNTMANYIPDIICKQFCLVLTWWKKFKKINFLLFTKISSNHTNKFIEVLKSSYMVVWNESSGSSLKSKNTEYK